MTQQEIERRLLALERLVPHGPGVSTVFGAGSTVYRDHFPARLTSTYNATTGYDWERLVLDRTVSSPTVVAFTGAESGGYAFTPDDDQTLTSGTEGYLVADPNAGGWIFLKSASTASAITTGIYSVATFAVGATGSGLPTAMVVEGGTGVSLAAGRYILRATAAGYVVLSASTIGYGAGLNGILNFQMRNDTTASAIGNGQVIINYSGPETLRMGAASYAVDVTFATTTVVKLQAQRTSAPDIVNGQTYTLCDIRTGVAGAIIQTTQIEWWKVG